MKHTASCQKQKQLAEEYEKQWPNYCKKCHGTGEVSWQENQSPLGSGCYWPETFTDFCEDCIGKGICPRCGKKSLELVVIFDLDDLWKDDSWRDTVKCPNCNWAFNSADAPVWECYCWENWEN